MTFVPVGREQTQAYEVAKYLRKRYSYWTADDFKPGEKVRIPYLKWADEDHHAAYLMVCQLNRIPVEA